MPVPVIKKSMSIRKVLIADNPFCNAPFYLYPPVNPSADGKPLPEPVRRLRERSFYITTERSTGCYLDIAEAFRELTALSPLIYPLRL